MFELDIIYRLNLIISQLYDNGQLKDGLTALELLKLDLDLSDYITELNRQYDRKAEATLKALR